jgi:hypothetical protein
VLGNKNGTCILNSLFPLKCVGFVLFNKQSLPYTLVKRGETFIFEVLDYHIGCIIGVKFHYITLKVQVDFNIIY